MSVEKVGESILRTFVSAAMKVQKLQMTQIRFEDAREMVNEEALLLDYAWERLNTGEWSAIDCGLNRMQRPAHLRLLRAFFRSGRVLENSVCCNVLVESSSVGAGRAVFSEFHAVNPYTNQF